MEGINFEVDKKHTNRKGDFVVVSISGNNMKIRWDNGETVDTAIKFQSRVVAKKLEIADDISSVFNILMPLYKASVMHI